MRAFSILAVCLLLGGTAGKADVIDTTGSWDGTSFVASFGIPNTQTYGQTVTVPAGVPTLLSFSFEMNLPSTLAFRGEVYAWNGTEATGPNLFESAVTTTAGTGFQLITFNTGGITLIPGDVYVLFASSSRDNSGHSGTGSWGQTQNSDTYAGGAFVFINNGTDTTQWTSTPWDQGFLGTGADLAFKANFVPEPGTMLLLSAGLLGLVIVARRRRCANKLS